MKYIWTYNPLNDSWSKVQTYYPGLGRHGMFAQVVNNVIIMGLGGDGSSGDNWYDDVWEFTPEL